MFSAFRSRISWFWLSWRAVSPALHYNSGSIDPRTVFLPRYVPVSTTLKYDASYNLIHNGVRQAYSIAPSNLLNYLYYSPNTFLGVLEGTDSEGRSAPDAADLSLFDEYLGRNGVPYFMYHSVFYHWFANWQEGKYYVVNDLSANPSVSKRSYYRPGSLEDLRKWLLAVGLNTDESINLRTFAVGNTPPPVVIQNAVLGGLYLCTHVPDALTAYISKASQQSIQQAARVAVTDGSFSIDSFIQIERIKKYLELGFLGASGYRDWVYAQFGVTPPADCGVPSCLGFSDLYVNFKTIVSTSSDGLGDLASRGMGQERTPLRRFNFTEYGTLMAFHTLVPIVSYSPAYSIEDAGRTLSDYGAPALQNIAWQPLLRSQLRQVPDLEHNDTSVAVKFRGNAFHSEVIGYQPSWSTYMTDYPVSYGDLDPRGTLSHWLLNRPFGNLQPLAAGTNSYTDSFNPSTYVFPTDYNVPFVDNAPTAKNFFVQVRLDIRARRPFSKKAIPTL